MAAILLADDEEILRHALARFMELDGHTVVQVGTGGEALEAARKESFDLVVLDLYMPGMDGMECLIRLKSENPDQKIIAISGGGFTDRESVLSDASKLGVQMTLTKPIERTDLSAAIGQVLGEDPPPSD